MKTLPAKIDNNGSWVAANIQIDEKVIHLPEPLTTDIPLKSIDDLQQRKNILELSVKGKEGPSYRIASVPKALTILKKVILMGCSGYRLMAYFMSPAIKGGVMVKDATWEKGAIVVLKSRIWFVGQTDRISISSGTKERTESPNTRPVEKSDWLASSMTKATDPGST